MASGVQTNAAVPAASTGPAGRHRVRARTQRRGHDQPVAGDADVELVVDGDVGDELAGAAADHDPVVGGPVVGRVRRGDLQCRQRPRGPVARPDAIEPVGELLGRDRAQRAQAPAGDAEDRRVARRRGAQRREHRAVAPHGHDEVAVAAACPAAAVAAAVAVDRELHHLDAVLAGPPR